MTIGMLYAANATKLLPDRGQRAEYARLLRFSTRCRAVAFDDAAQQFALWAGTLAVPMLRATRVRPRKPRKRKPVKLAKRKTLTLSLQARYNTVSRRIARSSMVGGSDGSTGS